MSSTKHVVKKVYAWSVCIENLAALLTEALAKNGDGDTITVEELSVVKTAEGKYCLAEESIKKIPEIECLYSDPPIIGQVFCHPDSKLKFAQSSFAGCDAMMKELQKTDKKPDFILSRQGGGFPAIMGEFVIGEIVARERKFNIMHQNQLQSKWDRTDVKSYRLLDSLTVAIIGLGTIGTEVARVCRALRMRVVGVVRDERFAAGTTDFDGVDEVSPLSKLSSVLESCDYLVNILPSTPQTTNLLSGDALKPCSKKKTVFINVGRGSVIDEESLVNAVTQGWLGGAILDVFNVEPLPSSSPLWTLPNVTITPHVSSVNFPELATDTFIYNLNAYRAGRPMKTIMDFTKGY